MMEGGEQSRNEADDDSDSKRTWIKIFSWIFLFLGVIVGIWGLVYVIMEMTSGDAKEDEA